jgi:hypothetical protein
MYYRKIKPVRDYLMQVQGSKYFAIIKNQGEGLSYVLQETFRKDSGDV